MKVKLSLKKVLDYTYIVALCVSIIVIYEIVLTFLFSVVSIYLLFLICVEFFNFIFSIYFISRYNPKTYCADHNCEMCIENNEAGGTPNEE